MGNHKVTLLFAMVTDLAGASWPWHHQNVTQFHTVKEQFPPLHLNQMTKTQRAGSFRTLENADLRDYFPFPSKYLHSNSKDVLLKL